MEVKIHGEKNTFFAVPETFDLIKFLLEFRQIETQQTVVFLQLQLVY